MGKIRVVHYLNQFFGQIGGEDKAGVGPQVREGPVGPGTALQQALGEKGEVVATVICGDNYVADNLDRAKGNPRTNPPAKPDALVAGPAFNAGRYGTACGAIGAAVAEELGIPVVSGMYEENPGADLYRKDIYIVSTLDSARGMRQAIPTMAALVLKLVRGGNRSPAAEDICPGYQAQSFCPGNWRGTGSKDAGGQAQGKALPQSCPCPT